MSILVGTIPLFVAWMALRITRDRANPISIMGLVWACAILYLALDPRYFSLSFDSLLYFALAFLAFAIGAGVVIFLGRGEVPRTSISDHAELTTKHVAVTYSLIAFLLVLGFTVYIEPYQSLFSEIGSIPLYVAYIRRASVQGLVEVEYAFNLIHQVPLYLNIVTLFLLAQFIETKQRIFLSLFFVMMSFVFLSNVVDGSRSLLFRYLVAMGAVLVICQKQHGGRTPYKTLGSIAAFMFFVFILVGAMRSTDESGSFSAEIPDQMLGIVTYVVGPLVSFSERFPDFGGVYSTDNFTYGWLSNLISGRAESVSVAYSYNGVKWSNAYTFLGGLVNDFGPRLSLVLVLFIGAFTSLAYLGCGRSIFFRVLYALLISSMIFSIYSEKFVSMVPHFLRIWVVYFLIYRIANMGAATKPYEPNQRLAYQ